MSGNTDQFIEYLLVKCRLVNTVKLQVFTHSKSLTKRIRKQLGWSKVVANIALNAYQEFLELKIISRDYDDNVITPSWCIREVWKTHAICDKKDYEEGCMGMCGRIIKYQVKKENQDTEAHEKFTEDVYKIRFNRSPLKPIWSFRFIPNWKNEYQTEKDLKYSKKVNGQHRIPQLTIKKAAELTVENFYGGGGSSKSKGNQNSSIMNNGYNSNNTVEQQQNLDEQPTSAYSLSSASNQEESNELPAVQSSSSSSSNSRRGQSTSSSNLPQQQQNPTSSSSRRKRQSSASSSQQQNSNSASSTSRRRQPSRNCRPSILSSASSTGSANNDESANNDAELANSADSANNNAVSVNNAGIENSNSNENQTPNRRRLSGQKRSITPRNPVMTRARTKLLRMNP
ncbi:uncharacterized protein [Clytia hemisphaerica]|uniref:Uncharacterized protein n=1 Tax=Clytia hemisphaerica TaxID=252671 RepID=A0A7M5WI32_9CNID